MQDIKTIHECLLDKTYNNKVEFELILDKIQDTKLVNGLLIDLYSLSEKYGCNKNDMIELAVSMGLLTLKTNKEDISEANNYFKSKLKVYNNSSMLKQQLLLDVLLTIKGTDDKSEFKILLETLSKQDLEYVKDYFLEKEWYDYIIIVNEYLNK